MGNFLKSGLFVVLVLGLAGGAEGGDPVFDKDAVLEALGKDKKRENDNVHFVLLNGLGHTVITDISLAELRRFQDL